MGLYDLFGWISCISLVYTYSSLWQSGLYKWALSSGTQSLEHLVGVFTFHKPLALFTVLKHLQGFVIRYFHGKGSVR